MAVVMIVDDHTDSAEVLAERLRREECHTSFVCDALNRNVPVPPLNTDGVLNCLNAQRPDAIILDRVIGDERQGGDKLALAIHDRVIAIRKGAPNPNHPDYVYAPYVLMLTIQPEDHTDLKAAGLVHDVICRLGDESPAETGRLGYTTRDLLNYIARGVDAESAAARRRMPNRLQMILIGPIAAGPTWRVDLTNGRCWQGGGYEGDRAPYLHLTGRQFVVLRTLARYLGRECSVERLIEAIANDRGLDLSEEERLLLHPTMVHGYVNELRAIFQRRMGMTREQALGVLPYPVAGYRLIYRPVID